MVYSQQTATFYGGEKAHAKVEDPALGFYQALVEARIPFEMVHDRLLDAEHVQPYRTLILPNIAALSDCSVQQLDGFRRAAAAAWLPPMKPRSTTSGECGGKISALASFSALRIAGGVEGPMHEFVSESGEGLRQ